MNPKKIAILLHKDDPGFLSTKYLIKLLMEEWKGMGFTIEVIQGTKNAVPADVLIPHIDLTLTPNRYSKYFGQYPLVINRDGTDISKSKISPNILREKDHYEGPVIVKTNRNSGGMPEKVLSSSIASK